MNFRNFNFALFAFVAAFIIGCAREDVEPAEVREPTPPQFIDYPLDLDALIANSEDGEDAVINQELVNIAQKLQLVLHTPEVREEIIALLKQDQIDFITMSDLISQVTSVADVFGADVDNFVFVHQDVEHEAVLTMPNLQIANHEAFPLVSPGIEVEDDEAKEIDDFIFAWVLNEDGEYMETAIGESQAISMNNPLFVVTPHPVGEQQDFSDPTNGFNEESETFIASTRATTPYFFDRLRVNHRYEKSGKSEIWIQNYRIDENGVHHWLPNSGGSDGKRQLAKFSKSDIGKTKTVSINFLNPNGSQENVTPAASNAAFFAVWERDWYSSQKNLGKICFNNKSLFYGGRRKYSSEWYSFNPSENDPSCSSNTTIQESRITFNQTMQQFNFQSSKGLLRLNFN